MARYLVTGLSGTGKSSVAKELTRRGYAAYDTDEVRALKKWVNLSSNETVAYELPVPDEWYKRNHLAWDRKALERLFKKHEDEPLFICGSSYNDAQFYPLFDKIFFLVVNASTLTYRLAYREGNQFGKKETERNEVLKWHHMIDYNELAKEHTGHVLNTDRQVSEVVDDMLALLKLQKSKH